MPDHQALLGDDVTQAGDESALTVRLQAIARGRADMAAQRLIDLQKLDDWIDTFGSALDRAAPKFTV